MTQSSTLDHAVTTVMRTPSPTMPAPPAGPPPARTGFFRGARKWRNRAIVVLMVVAAVFGTIQLINHQSARNFKLSLADVVLTSEPVEVNMLQAGVVTSATVRAGDTVVAGQRLGSVDVTSANAKGKAIVLHRSLRAPSNGVVVTDPTPVGSTLMAGSSFLEMYNPSALKLVTTVPLSYLPKISDGMSADLTAPGVAGTVTATLQRAVPLVGSNATAVPKSNVQLVLVAKRQASVAKLIPGLRFHGYLDTRTVTGSSNRAQYVGH